MGKSVTEQSQVQEFRGRTRPFFAAKTADRPTGRLCILKPEAFQALDGWLSVSNTTGPESSTFRLTLEGSHQSSAVIHSGETNARV